MASIWPSYRTAAVALAVLTVAGCGGGNGADDVLAEAAAKLRQIESGVVTMRVRISPKADDAQRVELELRGLFALDAEAGKPVARIVYTETRGRGRQTATLLAARGGIYAVVRGRAYELPSRRAARLEHVREILRDGDWRRRLRIDDWIEDAELDGGGVVDGARTDQVVGAVDVRAAAEDLRKLGRIFNGALGRLAHIDPELVEAATRSSEVRLFVGERDRLLRRLEVEIDVGFDIPSTLRRTLGGLAGARVYLELRLDDPNGPVTIAEPRGVRPASERPPP
jgi:hypothetical protein